MLLLLKCDIISYNFKWLQLDIHDYTNKLGNVCILTCSFYLMNYPKNLHDLKEKIFVVKYFFLSTT
jgi:hypothetical protein